jgi:sugar lactone lactonase YvrE
MSKKEPDLDKVVSSGHDPMLVHEAAGPVLSLAYNWRDARLAFCVGGTDGRVHELSGSGGRTERVFREGFSGSTVIRYDCEGRLLGSAGSQQPLARMLADGTGRELIASAFKTEPFEDIRGIAAHSSGMIHCSDARAAGKPSRIYLINGESKDVVSVSEAIRDPGSLCYSPDERYLYIAEPKNSRIMRMTILPSGQLDYRCLFAAVETGSHADGELAVDSLGHVFWSCGAGVHVFDRGGKHLGTIATDKACASICFAGRDLKTFLIAAQNRIWSLRVANAGARAVF